jgi:RNA polymerase sigma-70 factor (ECF subfamily)
MESTEARTIERVLGGDSDAFRLLVEQHSRPLFHLAWRLTRNEHDADDIVQETFLRAYRHLATFDSRSRFGTWLHRIAANVAFDLLQRRKASPADELTDDVIETLPGNAPSSDQIVIGLGVKRAMDAGMKELTANEQTAFALRHYVGMSIEEIGSVLGTESNATKNTIFRAVRKLRVALEPLVRTS